MRKPITKEILKLSDLILAGLIVLAAIVLFAASLPGRQGENPLSGTGHSVVVEVHGKMTHIIPFSEISGSLIVRIPAGAGSEATLELLETGRVRVIESTCPDKVCVRSGWISRSGQAIVCLPNRIVVRIEGSGTGRDPGSRLDAVTY